MRNKKIKKYHLILILIGVIIGGAITMLVDVIRQDRAEALEEQKFKKFFQWE